jgi:hypothetical protein
MIRILAIVAAYIVCAATWAPAGNFEVLADAGLIRPATSSGILGVPIVKTEFKGSLKATSDEDIESESLFPEPKRVKDAAGAKAKNALAHRERNRVPAASKQMSKPTAAEKSVIAANQDEDLEMEKDLILEPPPAKAEEKKDTIKSEEKKGGVKGAEKKTEAKPQPKVRRVAPDMDQLAQRPIQKVKPVTQNPWLNPAGNYPTQSAAQNRHVPKQVRRVPVPDYIDNPYGQEYPVQASAAPGRGPDRIVRDGVTVKLAPAAAAPPYAEMAEDNSGSDILSTATEILGMPFALISSFF